MAKGARRWYDQAGQGVEPKKTNLGLTNASLFLALRASKRDIRQQLLGLIFDVLNFLI